MWQTFLLVLVVWPINADAWVTGQKSGKSQEEFSLTSHGLWC